MSVISRLGLAARISSQLRWKSFGRGFGSAAAAELDYDDYYYYDAEEKNAKCRGGMEESGWKAVGRGVQWVIMGEPTVTRHVYADRLAKLLDVPHISMGSLVRQELTPNSPIYKQIATAVNQGKLVPENVIFGILSKRLEEGYYRGESGFILDGIPRTRMQAEILDQCADIDLVLNLKYKEQLSKKTPYAASGFNIRIPSEAEPDVSWKKKFGVYAEQRKSLEEYYKKQKKLLDFQVCGASAGDSWQGLLAALQLQHVNAAAALSSSSHKLTV